MTAEDPSRRGQKIAALLEDAELGLTLIDRTEMYAALNSRRDARA